MSSDQQGRGELKPKAGSDRFDVRHEGENVVLVERKGGREIVLDPIAGAVWLRADGAHDVRELAAVVGRDLDALIGEPEVWATPGCWTAVPRRRPTRACPAASCCAPPPWRGRCWPASAQARQARQPACRARSGTSLMPRVRCAPR
mgnify:CR=1 FL=1